MGLYTSVYKDRRCPRCGIPYRCEFQFKHGNDQLEVYEDGARASHHVPRRAFGAHRQALCGECGSFLGLVGGWIMERAQKWLLNIVPHVEVFYSNDGGGMTGLRVGGKELATIHTYGTGARSASYSLWFEKRTPLVNRLTVLLEDHWKAHAKAAHLSKFLKTGWDKQKYNLVWNKDRYLFRLDLTEPDSRAAIVDVRAGRAKILDDVRNANDVIDVMNGEKAQQKAGLPKGRRGR